MKERKSVKFNLEKQRQEDQNGYPSPFKFAKLLDPEASGDKDQLGDVLHWIRQVVALVCGLLWGAVPLVGGLWMVMFLVISSSIIYGYYAMILKVDEEDFGGHGSLLQEGLFASLMLFLVLGLFFFLSFFFFFHFPYHVYDLRMAALVHGCAHGFAFLCSACMDSSIQLGALLIDWVPKLATRTLSLTLIVISGVVKISFMRLQYYPDHTRNFHNFHCPIFMAFCECDTQHGDRMVLSTVLMKFPLHILQKIMICSPNNQLCFQYSIDDYILFPP